MPVSPQDTSSGPSFWDTRGPGLTPVPHGSPLAPCSRVLRASPTWPAGVWEGQLHQCDLRVRPGSPGADWPMLVDSASCSCDRPQLLPLVTLEARSPWVPFLLDASRGCAMGLPVAGVILSLRGHHTLSQGPLPCATARPSLPHASSLLLHGQPHPWSITPIFALAELPRVHGGDSGGTNLFVPRLFAMSHASPTEHYWSVLSDWGSGTSPGHAQSSWRGRLALANRAE